MPSTGIASFERRRQRLLSRRRFAGRMLKAVGLWCMLAVVGLAIGMAGYACFEGMGWTESFLNASMILSGMGPASPLNTTAGKWFAGAYALYSGIAFLAVTALLYAPLLHRLLHRFHADEKDLLLDETQEESRQ